MASKCAYVKAYNIINFQHMSCDWLKVKHFGVIRVGRKSLSQIDIILFILEGIRNWMQFISDRDLDADSENQYSLTLSRRMVDMDDDWANEFVSLLHGMLFVISIASIRCQNLYGMPSKLTIEVRLCVFVALMTVCGLSNGSMNGDVLHVLTRFSPSCNQAYRWVYDWLAICKFVTVINDSSIR